LLLDPEMAFGDGYACGAIDIEGDLLAVLDASYRVFPESPGGYRDWLRGNTTLPPRDSVHHHYDLATDFYRLWLDEPLVYTCAYFAGEATTLEQAQRAKLDYVCRKLRLRPGERVIEAGCGWGALAIHMASHYGVGVKAYNLSHEQIVFARARARREGVSARIEFIEDDFRTIQGRSEVFVSLGMLEHVGARHLADLGAVIDRSLDADCGRGLLHFIGRNQPQELSAWIRRRIFPGAYVPTLAEVTEAICEPWDLSIVDVENLRRHYAETLAEWLARFEHAAGAVREMYDEAFVRAWRLYLAGSVVAFRTGTLQLYQLAFSRRRLEDVPRTRAYLYRPEEAQ
jgi:cyclopropane-fatty-acyl-phospholipid synthase